MGEVMMALGDFKFSIDGPQYQALTTSMGWRWAKKERYQRKPGMQFHGPDTSSKTLDVAIYPQVVGDLGIVGRLQAMANEGQPLRLVAGGSRWVAGFIVPSGTDLGLWIVQRLEVAEQFFMADGTPLEIKARMTIAEYGDDEVFA